jgi:hypothetical protein
MKAFNVYFIKVMHFEILLLHNVIQSYVLNHFKIT